MLLWSEVSFVIVSRLTMTTIRSVICLLACLVVMAIANNNRESVNVTVYYRTDYDIDMVSINFITKQVYPTFRTLNAPTQGSTERTRRMVLTLVPYESDAEDVNNKCAYSHRNQFSYCLSNKIHSCIVRTLRHDDWAQLNLINCLVPLQIQGTLPRDRLDECVATTCFDDTSMASCVNSVDGDDLMKSNWYKFHELGFNQRVLPLITFNGVYNEQEQVSARSNLLALMCHKFAKVYRDGVCDWPRARRTMSHNNFDTYYFYPERSKCDF